MTAPERPIEIRPPTLDDLPGIDELYRIVKGRARPEQVTRHRFFDTPWGASPSLIAVHGDRVVAAGVIWPVELRVGEELILGGQGTDAVTHPDYRNRPRLFLSLAKEAVAIVRDRGIALYYTFPNERSIKLTKLVGGVYLGTVGAWGFEVPRRRLPFSLPRRSPSDLTVHSTPTDEITRFIEEVNADRNVIRVEKSSRWLDWRYSEASGDVVEWLLLHEEGTLVAAALVGARDPDLWGPDFAGLARIHELFAASDSSCETLLRHVISRVTVARGRKVDVLVKDPLLERAVERAGFVRESDRPITTFILRDDLVPDPLEFDRWRVISGDMDFF